MPPRRSILAALSPDLLLLVLDRLPSPADRKSLRLVCRDLLLLADLHARSLTLLRPDRLPSFLARFRSLEALDLSKCPRIDDRALAAAAAGGGWSPRLRRVDLTRTSAVTWRGLEALVGSCPGLERVDLGHCCGVGDREVAAVAGAKGLRELGVAKCLGITDVGLARVAVGCLGLEKLCLKWCLEVSDIGVELLVKKCRGLRDLDLSYLKITNESLRSISTLEKLESLTMVKCSYVDDDGLAYLDNGHNCLLSIDVSRCENISSTGLASVIGGHNCLQSINAAYCFPEITPLFLSRLKDVKNGLKTIKLDGFHASASILETIGIHCKMLVEMGLNKCTGVTDEGVSKLVSGCSSLRVLDLTCCHLITDDAICAIGSCCKMLTCLKLESCNLLTDKGLDQIGSHCALLQEIDLTDCGITDAALKYISRCSELVELRLGLCYAITDKGLSHIASACKKLQVLDLYRCSGVGDEGLASVASGCKNLKKLNICYCIQISDRGIKYLSGLEELLDLEMRSLGKVTRSGIAAIAIGCRSLVEIDLKRCYGVDDMALFALAQRSGNLRQINVSYCSITDVGLCLLLGNLRCLQDAKLVHLTRVSAKGLEHALRASWDRLKKLKLLIAMRDLLSPDIIPTLEARGCRIRWVNKPLILD